MVKTLTKHGNSLALLIDKPILDLLKIDADTPLNISTDGRCLIIAPADPKRRKKLEAGFKNTVERYSGMLKRLAE
jgi:antitoxin MazE